MSLVLEEQRLLELQDKDIEQELAELLLYIKKQD